MLGLGMVIIPSWGIDNNIPSAEIFNMVALTLLLNVLSAIFEFNQGAYRSLLLRSALCRFIVNLAFVNKAILYSRYYEMQKI